MAHTERERESCSLSFRRGEEKKCGGEEKIIPIKYVLLLFFRLLARAREIWSYFTFLKLRNLCAAKGDEQT